MKRCQTESHPPAVPFASLMLHAPLRVQNSHGAVLFQFPPWFIYRPTKLKQILRCSELLAGYQLAVEFRHQSWFVEKHRELVLAFERKHGLAQVAVDEPQGFAGSIPPVWEVTCPELAVVRLHGRNRETWDKDSHPSAERFNYLYADAELLDLAEPVRRLGENALRVHVLFANNYSNMHSGMRQTFDGWSISRPSSKPQSILRQLLVLEYFPTASSGSTRLQRLITLRANTISKRGRNRTDGRYHRTITS